MIKENGESLCQGYLADQILFALLEKCDSNLAEKYRQGGCLKCGGKLHRGNFERKPRGGPGTWNERDSFCCADCRKRLTPPSVRFLGRKVYVGWVVVLVAAMRHGLTAQRVRLLREALGLKIDRRTLAHWREWWQHHFVQSAFWKMARARFTPPCCEKTLPRSLCEAFQVERRDRLLDLLKFLSPITTGSVPLERAF